MIMVAMAETGAGAQVGARIRAERARLGWSQQQLAIQARVERTWIASLEAGNTEDPGAARMLAIAKAMGLTVEYLMTGASKEPGESERLQDPLFALSLRKAGTITDPKTRRMVSRLIDEAVRDEEAEEAEESG